MKILVDDCLKIETVVLGQYMNMPHGGVLSVMYAHMQSRKQYVMERISVRFSLASRITLANQSWVLMERLEFKEEIK